MVKENLINLEKLSKIYFYLDEFLKKKNHFKKNNLIAKNTMFLNSNKLKEFEIYSTTEKNITKKFNILIEELNINYFYKFNSIYNLNKNLFQVYGIGIYFTDIVNKEIIQNLLNEINNIIIKLKQQKQSTQKQLQNTQTLIQSKKFVYDTKEKKALIQNTHAKKTKDFSHYICRNIKKTLNDFICFKPNKKIEEVIIIENRECFARYKEFLNENYFENLPNLKNCLIIYGEGSAINSKKLKDSFLKYKKVHCFLDYDYASFQMFENIKHNNKIFYYPKQNILKNIIELIYYHQKLNKNKVIVTCNIINNSIEKDNNNEYFFNLEENKITQYNYLNSYLENVKNIDLISNKKEIIKIEQEILLLKNLDDIDFWKI